MQFRLIIFLTVLYNYIGYPKAIWNHSFNNYCAPQIAVHCISAIIIQLFSGSHNSKDWLRTIEHGSKKITKRNYNVANRPAKSCCFTSLPVMTAWIAWTCSVLGTKLNWHFLNAKQWPRETWHHNFLSNYQPCFQYKNIANKLTQRRKLGISFQIRFFPSVGGKMASFRACACK